MLLKYGEFLQSIVDFMIIAFVIFLAIKAINKLEAPDPAAANAPPPPPPRQEVLLEDPATCSPSAHHGRSRAAPSVARLVLRTVRFRIK